MLKQLLLVSCLCFSASAHADVEADQASLKVRYADLDLSSELGQRHFEARVRAALVKACDNGEDGSLLGHVAKRHCVAVAKEAAASQVKAALARASDRMHLASK